MSALAVPPRLTSALGVDADDHRRLAFSLLAAFVLHGVLLGWDGWGRPALVPDRPTLDLRLLPAPAGHMAETVPLRPERAGSRATGVDSTAQAVPAMPMSPAGSSTGLPEATGETSRPEASGSQEMTGALAASALEAARRLAREPGDPRRPASPGNAERPFLPALDRAIAREAPGEKRLANGLIRVVTAAGTVYCVQTMADFMQGPGGVRSLVVTCP